VQRSQLIPAADAFNGRKFWQIFQMQAKVPLAASANGIGKTWFFVKP